MNEILNKLTSYNIFNNLLPGAILGFWISSRNYLNVEGVDLITLAFIYYFLGMVVSRVGSLVIAPILRKCKLVEFSDYRDFISACKNDAKIEILSETNNIYRTLISLFVIIGCIEIINQIALNYKLPAWLLISIGILSFILLFVFSYIKQTDFIVQRINININKDND